MRELTNSFAELNHIICDSLLRDADFRRLIFYDTPDALSEAEPSDEAAKDLVASPEPFATDGKRIFLQELLPTVTDSKTSVQIWTAGMTEEIPGVLQKVKVKIRVMNHLALETIHNGSKTISRSLAVVQRIYAVLCDEMHDPWMDDERFIAGMKPLHMTEVVRVSDNRERCGYEITIETDW